MFARRCWTKSRIHLPVSFNIQEVCYCHTFSFFAHFLLIFWIFINFPMLNASLKKSHNKAFPWIAEVKGFYSWRVLRKRAQTKIWRIAFVPSLEYKNFFKKFQNLYSISALPLRKKSKMYIGTYPLNPFPEDFIRKIQKIGQKWSDPIHSILKQWRKPKSKVTWFPKKYELKV